MKCPRCQQEGPSHAKFCLGCGTPLSDVIIAGRSYADLQAEIDGLRRELGEALEQQTATSEILRAISASPTDLQVVLDTVAASAARLCNSVDAQIFRIDGTMLRIAASYGQIPKTTSAEARLISRGSVNGRAVVDRQTIHVHDLAAESDTEFPVGKAYQKLFGHRTVVATPLLREGAPIGAITIRRMEVRPFSEKELTLLETFADQAVIAIENVRLFKELEEKNRALTEAHAQVMETLEQQTATAEILRVISSSPTDLQPMLDAVGENAARLCDASNALILRVDGDVVRLVAQYGALAGPPPEEMATGQPINRDWVTGRCVVERRTIHVHDLAAEGDEYPYGRVHQQRIGHRTTLATPLLREGVALGAILIRRMEVRPFSARQIALLETFADQAVIAIENVRLFKELADKSRQLEVASQHKSEFLANMSHELRTPLNAVIGFSEVLTERMFGELNEKQDEYVRDIHASGTHLLSLINDILDLSKIEAGHMELELADFHLPQAIENALVLVRERALRRGITLEQSIDPRLGEMQGDERKIKQVLLNLLSNAIKFTPEGGRVGVRAEAVDEHVEVAVSDTGIGIAPEDHEAVFEEFRQVGTAEKKAEGTGLGLALARKFIGLHGGRIWLKSQLGVGSTFTFTLPVLHGE